MRHDDCRSAVLKGELTSAVCAHLEECAACARLADAMARMQADLREVPPTSPRLAERVLERTAPAVEPEPLVARPRVLRSLRKRRLLANGAAYRGRRERARPTPTRTSPALRQGGRDDPVHG